MIAIDACSIILLSKCTVLEDFARWKKITITEEVYKEVAEGKEKKFLDALLTERLVEEHKISIKKIINKILLQKVINDFGLGLGEAESIIIALESGKNIIVTDNKQGRKVAKIYGIYLAGSIDVVIALFKSRKITKEKAISALKSLKNSGWFADYLIDSALQEVQDD